ncbi:MAG: hypothetical protein NTY12_00770 [Candidatus Falkowbacteria bacterium]|nr:hypothetical protein [Candidatus Falkowbacteria bacterium]
MKSNKYFLFFASSENYSIVLWAAIIVVVIFIESVLFQTGKIVIDPLSFDILYLFVLAVVIATLISGINSAICHRVINNYITQPCFRGFSPGFHEHKKILSTIEKIVFVDKPIWGKGEEHVVNWHNDSGTNYEIDFGYIVPLGHYSLNIRMAATVKLDEKSFDPKELHKLIQSLSYNSKSHSIESLLIEKFRSFGKPKAAAIEVLSKKFLRREISVDYFVDKIEEIFLPDDVGLILSNIQEAELALCNPEIIIIEDE